MSARRNGKSHYGVIVPMVTPITAARQLDEPAVARLLDHLHAGGVHGVFVLGTTGEGPSVPAAMRERLVKLVVARAKGRLRVYAGVSGGALGDTVEDGNRFLAAGANAVVAHVPASFELQPAESLEFFSELADRLHGNLIIYNMPLTTRVSLPIDVCRETARRPRVVGIKDSENDAHRLGQLLQAVKGESAFSVFVGTGPLMASGLLQGADGIVPSVGNLVPTVVRELYDCATNGHPQRVETLQRRMMELSAIYQKGRTLGQSIAALKAAMSWLGLCEPAVFPPLRAVSRSDRLALREELVRHGVLPPEPAPDERATTHRPDPGRPGGSRAGTVPSRAG